MNLTIILTVYNKQVYLHNAFQALLNQKDTRDGDYEILVVNDGSTDGSATIIGEYARRDSRVRVLTQKNQGLSMARNNGADAANGDYVWFVDADDTYSPKAVSLICKAMESKPDVIPIYAKTDGVDKVRNAIPTSVTTGKDVILCGCWQQCGVFWVFRKDFLRKNNLRFMPGVFHEDAEFTPRMLYAANTVKVIPEVLYTVYRDPNSITQVPRPKRAFDYLTVSESLSRFVMDNHEERTAIGKAIDSYTAQDINNSFYIICKNSKEEQRQLDSFFYEKQEVLIRVLKNAMQKKYKIEAFLFLLFPKHYVQVYKTMKLLGK